MGILAPHGHDRERKKDMRPLGHCKRARVFKLRGRNLQIERGKNSTRSMFGPTWCRINWTALKRPSRACTALGRANTVSSKKQVMEGGVVARTGGTAKRLATPQWKVSSGLRILQKVSMWVGVLFGTCHCWHWSFGVNLWDTLLFAGVQMKPCAQGFCGNLPTSSQVVCLFWFSLKGEKQQICACSANAWCEKHERCM